MKIFRSEFVSTPAEHFRMAWRCDYFCSINNNNKNDEKASNSAAVKCAWHEIYIKRVKEKAACLLWINGNIFYDLMIILWLWQLSIHIKRFLYTFALLCSPSLVQLTWLRTYLNYHTKPIWRKNNNNSSNPVALFFFVFIGHHQIEHRKITCAHTN